MIELIEVDVAGVTILVPEYEYIEKGPNADIA